MPWDQIRPTSFNTTGHISEETIDSINEKYQSSLEKDKKLLDLLAEIADVKATREETKVSLNETQRREEQKQEGDDLTATVDPESGTPERQEIDDPYIYSGVNILAELVKLNKSK